MPRRAQRRGRHALTFGTYGWLFADLLLALAAAFLVADTFGATPPPPLPTPTTVAVITPSPIPTATPVPPPALDLHPISMSIQIDVQGVLNGDPTAIANAENQIRANAALANRRAGLVLAFGGSPQSNAHYGIQIAQAFDANVLSDLGRNKYVFQATVYREFFTLGGDPGTVNIDIYVFKQ